MVWGQVALPKVERLCELAHAEAYCAANTAGGCSGADKAQVAGAPRVRIADRGMRLQAFAAAGAGRSHFALC